MRTSIMEEMKIRQTVTYVLTIKKIPLDICKKMY